jgi:eukaryotic-like serine/threonine-protein kinase
MELKPGAKLGPYEIIAMLGKGGMGEVWRARDPRLGREVAIKISAEQFSDRFEREARAVAALSHAHICRLYDVGPDYIVFEYVDGAELKGPMPVARAVELGSQILDALDAAHRKGIVHRDLKPANILVTKTGVMVLDFGLATMQAQTMAVGADAATAVSVEGSIAGTLYYMAPEQLQGKEVDSRADIFSFGCVLYEMLTGRRAFDGSNAASVIAAVMDRPAPSIADIAPPTLDRLLKRCLAKDPDDRWQSARDLRAELLWIAAGSDTAVVPVSRTSISRWLFAAGAVAIAALGVGGGYAVRSVPLPNIVKLSIPPPPGTSFVSVSQAGPVALSPDGRMIAFSAQKAGQDWSLWIRSLDSFEARPLPGTDGAIIPFWSPDNKSLGFGSRGELRRIDLASGSGQILSASAAVAGGQQAPNGAWSPNGTILFAPRVLSSLITVSAGGGEVGKTTQLGTELHSADEDAAQFWPAFLPDGRHFIYNVRTATGAHLDYAGMLGSKDRKLLLKDATNARYAPPRAGYPGELLYVRNGTLWAQAFDPAHLTFSSEPAAVAEHIASTNVGTGADFSVSADGVLAWREGEAPQSQLGWYDNSGKALGSALQRPGAMTTVRLSPDGKRVAFSTLADVWLYDLTRGVLTRFTFGRGFTPVWSPDGGALAFLRAGSGIVRKAANGTGPEDLLWKDSGNLGISDWSADGNYMLITRPDPAGRNRLWLLPLTGDRNLVPLPQTAFDESNGVFSPAMDSSRWIAYQSNESGRPEVYVTTMPGQPPGRWQISSGGGAYPHWRRDGRELYYLEWDQQTVMAVPIDGGANFRAGSPHVLFKLPQPAASADVSADGKRFLFSFSGTAAPASSISVVLNWQAGLKK